MSDIEAVVLLDACMACLDHCQTGCCDDINIHCTHRFHGKVGIITCNGFGSFMRFSDSQVILYFLWLLMTSGIYQTLSKDCRYIIVTRDKNFLRQLEKEWEKKRNPKTVPIMFFYKDEVRVVFKNHGHGKNAEWKEITVEVLTIQNDRVLESSVDEVLEVIGQINKLVFDKK